MSETDDSNIYEEEALERAEEDDEIDELEEGFMKGYEEEDAGTCHRCKKALIKEDLVEIESNDGEYYNFCSEKCVERFEKKH